MLIRICICTALLFVGFILGFRANNPIPQPAPPVTGISTLVAVLPDGHRLYKVTSSTLIVPTYVLISPTGHCAIR